MATHRVLVIAPSRKTRGGITAVVNAYSQTSMWQNWNCYWIQTHIDRGALLKIGYFIKSFFLFLIKLPRYQIVHIHFSEPVSAVRKSFFFVVAYVFRKKIIVHFHSFSPDTTIKSKYKWLYKFLFTKADRAVVLSQFWQDEVRIEIGEKVNPIIIFNPSLSVAVRSGRKQSHTTNYILFAGTLNDRKGFKDLIKGFSLIAKKYPDWKIVFAGNGEIESGMALSKQLNIEQQVEFAGWISGSKKEEVFTNASIFCLPSYAEGFPMAVLDAMSFSLPVIATPVGGTTDVFKDDYHLLIFKPGDINELADKLQRLIDSDDLKDTLVANSAIVLRDNFTLSKVTEKVAALYQSLVKD